MRFSTAELADQLGGTLSGPDLEVEGASIDSRSVIGGQLFVPIIAERDGHDFIDAARQAGAAAYLTSQPAREGTAIEVADTSAALSELGVLARRKLVGRTIGITGSVGKTTTKDLLAGALATSFRTTASERSLNNELGLPLTLFNSPADAEWVVLEMGTRGFGHIRDLCAIALPSVGIVTNVGMAHVEFLENLDGVFRAKSELVIALPADGAAVLNADDERVVAMRELAAGEVITFGLTDSADVTASEVSVGDDLRASFRLHSPWGSGDVTLAVRGEPQVSNALAAAAAALWCGAPVDAVLSGLSGVTGSAMRMDVRRPRVGPTLIIDCYNANPVSTAAAVRSLARLDADEKVALLGPMAELGGDTAAEHRAISELASSLNVRVIGFRTDLYGSEQMHSVPQAVELVQGLHEGDALLIKGSRVAKLEDVVRAYGTSIGEALLSD